MRWLFGAVLLNAASFSKGVHKCPEDISNDKTILFADEYDCTKFYKCNRGKKLLFECPEGLHFNSQENLCDWPMHSHCKSLTNQNREINVNKDKTCLLENPLVDILLPHEYDCSKFYQCNEGLKVVQSCPTGLHFNSGKHCCDWPWNADCDMSEDFIETLNGDQRATENSNPAGMDSKNGLTSSNGIKCPFEYSADDVLLAHLTDCTKFIHCSHGQPVEKDCPAGLYFNSATSRCDGSWNVECKNINLSINVTYPNNYTSKVLFNKSCPLLNQEHDVLLPHESNCRKFYKCNWGQKVLQDCPAGLYFNIRKNYCDWPEESYCFYTKYYAKETVSCTPDFPSYYFLPHESDCQKFYICFAGTLHLITCSPNLYFNPEVNSCEEFEDISCGTNTPS